MPPNTPLMAKGDGGPETLCFAFVGKMTGRSSPMFLRQARPIRTMRSRTPPVGVARAAALPLRPVRVCSVEGARQRAHRALSHRTERLSPAVLQRCRPHRAGLAPGVR